tara:strand:+ start:901 stop:2409 length:1509 start_codon:yes stop_codon:yes gene_type:complete
MVENNQERENEKSVVLVTGATGYIGGRLITAIDSSKFDIRCLVRNPDYIEKGMIEDVEIYQGDILDKESLIQAMEGVDIAYYLVHSMGGEREDDFEEIDRVGATNFIECADAMGIKKIVYFGGLGGNNSKLSPHLRSRHEVGEIFRTGRAQIIELQASIVIGSGSISFEMIRALVEKLPIMITPRWVATQAQPIAIEDVLQYLKKSSEIEFKSNQIFQIGGADVVSYGKLMEEYAEQRKLKRIMIKVPILTPRLSSLWLGLITPVYARIGRKLVDSLRNTSVVENGIAENVFAIQPMGIKEAISSAMVNEDREFAQTRWSDSVSSSGLDRRNNGEFHGSRVVEVRMERTHVSPERAFYPVKVIGGENGWYYANWLWKMRASIDLLVGGIGIRRGRKNPFDFAVGETVDWWRVESYEEDKRVRFRGEFKLPGRAWLEFEVEKEGRGSIIRQTVEFDPKGISGLLYWYALLPIHRMIFKRMLKKIAEEAEGEDDRKKSSLIQNE